MIMSALVTPMRRVAPLLLVLMAGAAVTLSAPDAIAQPQGGAMPQVPAAPFVMPPASAEPRMIVFISDLHFGLGKRPDGRWSPKEDFRWPDALKGFLNEMGRRGNDRVDLVIVGDFLELWQPPSGIACDASGGADLGCTVPQIVSIARTVIDAHQGDLALLRDFAKRGDNRLYVIPGNHDAALLLPQVWSLLAAPLDQPAGRVALVTRGLWMSSDGRIVAEHGHQVGNDVNRYDRWPAITRDQRGTTYLERPWGERFVQQVFNSQEEEYEIIDNVAPETVGVKYRIADRGYVRTVADVARFIAFNLFETSLAQKDASLGTPDENAADRWDIKLAREEIGYGLFLEALAKDDPLRAEIEGRDAVSEALRTELAALVRDDKRLTDDEVRALCEHLARREAPRKCAIATAGALLESTLVERPHVIGTHVEGHLRTDARLNIFVYGHTHGYEKGWPLKLRSGSEVTVHNTGAFQRTIDEAGFLALVAQKNLAPSEALRKIKLEDLPPCYSAVLVTYASSGVPASKTWRWHQQEGGTGTLVELGDNRCN
ncbi:metallophosphoesterase [Bradyrhizobium sp. Mp27]|uniref:metallophosphoesterase n=1 Tax=Bradyrhizobium sp. Mp27 TaxID=3042157 RepID=UPI00248B9EC5|nr:metallophosphoesterase [Bradyrhizobium sp. Mp27]MDI2077405.1 metallophosphoesterase [Bradyrhizobium sp. Mp27]